MRVRVEAADVEERASHPTAITELDAEADQPLVAPGGKQRGETAAAVSAWIGGSVACRTRLLGAAHHGEDLSEVRGTGGVGAGPQSRQGRDYPVTPTILRRSPGGETAKAPRRRAF